MGTLTTLRNPAQWLLDRFGGSKNKIQATEKTTMMSAPFWYGVNRISGNIGTLPMNLRRTLPDGGSEKATDDDRYWLMRDEPNQYQTPLVFKQAEAKRAIMWGNSRSVIVRHQGRLELLPQPPSHSVTGMIDGEKVHVFAPSLDDRITKVDDLMEEMLQNPNKTIMRPDREVYHVQGFGDGIVGLSLIEYAETSIKISLSADQNTLNQNEKGFNGKAMLEAPEGSAYFNDEKKAKEFLKDFEKKHGRDGRADAVGLLRAGVKLNVLQMSNRDAEFIEQLKFRRQDAALWLLLESILGDDSSVSYNSLEQKQLAYLCNCLGTWLVRQQEEANRKLLTREERRKGLHYMFNVASILKTDAATSAEIFTKYLQNKVFNPNEVRIKLDENPYEGGNTYENPNITPGPTQVDEQDASASAVQDRMEGLLKVEQNRVSGFLGRGDSIERISQWYDGWETTLGNAIEKIGGCRSIASSHCENNLKYLGNQPETFDLTGSAELLTKEILGNV